MTETTGNLRSIVQLVGINVISLCLMCALCGSKREGQPSDTRTQRGRSDELAMLSPLLSLIALSCVLIFIANQGAVKGGVKRGPGLLNI